MKLNMLGRLWKKINKAEYTADEYGQKSCPFCGGKAEYGISHDVSGRSDRDTFYMYCSECHVRTPEYTKYEFARDAWNKREKK